jgi:hypothetical protein
MNKLLLTAIAVLMFLAGLTQPPTDSLLNAVKKNEIPGRQLVENFFKSPRVINGASVEMLPAGVLDFRIMHRFGVVKDGLYTLYGLDNASMRMSFDYGITKIFSMGIGRSTFNKELDLSAKLRFAAQTTGEKPFPVAIVGSAGITCFTTKYFIPNAKIDFSKRMGYYAQLAIARKFGQLFSFQISPTIVSRDSVLNNNNDKTTIALGLGGRVRLSKHMHLVMEAFPSLSGLNTAVYQMPLSFGIDIETGGHVFQLHFTNAHGMTEKSVITNTTNKWGKREFEFGFNLSRVFTIKKNKQTSL